MRTNQAVSKVVSAPEILFSIILFSLIYLLLGVLWIYLLVKKIKHGPEGDEQVETLGEAAGMTAAGSEA